MNQEQFDKFVANFSPERAIFFAEDPLCVVRVTRRIFGVYYQEVYRIVNINAFSKESDVSNVEVVWVHPSVALLKPGTILKGAPS